MAKRWFWRKWKRTIPALALASFVAATPVMAENSQHDGNHYDGNRQEGQWGHPDGDKHRNIQVQLLGINDLHGQLDVTRKVAGRDVGRADYLAAYLNQRKAANPNTLLVHAGDAVGASAPVSALLQDEPTIDFLNQMHFDVGTVGNHEFDEGVGEMLRLVYGGKHPKTGYFAGAKFPYVAANLVYKDSENYVLPPYVIKKVKGVPIGFIGVVLSDTPDLVMPGGVADVKFTDEAEAINKAAAELKKRGVKSIVVLAHNPGSSETDGTNPQGELVDIANHTDKEVDVIFGGHNHAYMNAVVNDKLLVEAYSYGTAFSDVDLEIDPATKDIVSKKAEIVTTYHDQIQPDAKITKLIDKYEQKVAPIVNEKVGDTATSLSNANAYTQEIALGNLIADSMRSQMKTDMAFMNPGGIRAGIDQGEITWGELFNVQPFNNDLVKMNLPGAKVRELLEQQWSARGQKTMQISGLKYTWDSTKPIGSKVVDIFLPDGMILDADKTYTLTVNNFMAGGGDGYTALLSGTAKETGPVDIDSLVNYVKQLPNPFTYAEEGRITKLK